MRADLWGELASWVGLALASAILGMLLLVGSAKAGPYSEVEVPALEWHNTTVWPEYQDDPWWMGGILYAKGDIDRCIWSQTDMIPVDFNEMPPLDPGPRGSCQGSRKEYIEYRGSNPNFGFGPVHGTAWRLYPPATVPEPGTLALIGLGLVGFALRRLRA